MVILITGFEPFGGSHINPSEQVVKALAQQNTFAGHVLVGMILPVNGAMAPDLLRAALREHQPEVVICLGEAARRTAVSVERVAINLMDYRIADNQGQTVQDQEIIANGPAAYFASLPVRKIVERLLGAGIPAELSLSAGTFLCNQIMYVLLDEIAKTGLKTRAGFIHLPPLPEQAARATNGLPSMSLETSQHGVRLALETVLEDL